MYRQHPLVEAIRIKKKAIRKKAHPKVIARLEARVKEEASKSLDILTAGTGSLDWIDKLSKDIAKKKGKKNEQATT